MRLAIVLLALAACGDNIKPVEGELGLLEITPSTGLETSEAGTTATFTVKLIAKPRDNIVVDLTSSNLAEGTVSPASITFDGANWDEPQTVTITGVNDFVEDDDQELTINVDAATWGVGDVAVTNLDNDTSGITVTPTTGLETSEEGTTATFTVVLTSEPTADVTVTIASSDTGEGTVSPTTLTFSDDDWDAGRTITITGVNDDVADNDQDFTITVAAATSSDAKYNGIDPTDVSVTNLDNDTPNFIVSPTTLSTTEGDGTSHTAEFTVRLATEPTGDVTIDVTSGDLTEGTVSDATLTFTTVNWSAAQTVTVTGVDDAQADGDIGYTITLDNVVSTDTNYTAKDPSDVEVMNSDNDQANIELSRTSGLVTTEPGESDTFTIVLLTQPSADVEISYESSDTTEALVSPPSPITFTPSDWDQPKTISAVGVQDLITDGDQPFTITLTATSTDADYDNFTIPAVSGINKDDDVAGVIVTPLRLDVAEFNNDPGDTFEVSLTRIPVGTVTIPLTVSDDTEGTINKTSLVFTTLNWNVPQTVTVKGVDDALIDGQQQFYVRTEPATSTDVAYQGVNGDDVLVFNFDDESPGVYVQGHNLLKTQEGQNQPQYIRMRLTIAPTSPVTCTVVSSDPGEVSVTPGTFTFDSTNFSQMQTITVRGVDDPDPDGDQEVIIITEPCTSLDPVYNLFDPRNIRVLNRDDET